MQFLKIQFSLYKYLDFTVNSNLQPNDSKALDTEWRFLLFILSYFSPTTLEKRRRKENMKNSFRITD